MEAKENDLNTAAALGAVFSLVREINILIAEGGKKTALEEAKKTFETLTGILGLCYNRKNADAGDTAEIEALIEQRTAAKKAKNFAEADAIRDRLKEMGITLQDTPQGVKWSRD